MHAAGEIPDFWWRQATRYHIPPFYTVPIDGVIADAPESQRNHSWLPRMGLEVPASSVEESEGTTESLSEVRFFAILIYRGLITFILLRLHLLLANRRRLVETAL